MSPIKTNHRPGVLVYWATTASSAGHQLPTEVQYEPSMMRDFDSFSSGMQNSGLGGREGAEGEFSSIAKNIAFSPCFHRRASPVFIAVKDPGR